MTAYDESTGHPVIWRLMFVLLECLNIYTCLIFFTNILAYNIFFFIVLHYHYIKIVHEGFSVFLMLVSVQQWCVKLRTFNCRYILR